jgi:methylthioribose-1-phosphate isomerase
LDQTKLPLKEVWKECKTLKQGFEAIRKLEVRGAPLIGVFAAYCIVVAMKSFPSSKEKFFVRFIQAVSYLKTSRPTAVNLFWALDRLEDVLQKTSRKPLSAIRKAICAEADAIYNEDILLCRKMGEYGAKLVKRGDRILTHCNAGALATSGTGTAVAVIYEAYRHYKNIKVYVDETRPLLQGARLTAWELVKEKIPSTLICDNMAAYLMQRGCIDKVFVGADRIAANGDVANKIGTYSLAVNAYYHGIPFYVVAPFSTFDLSLENGQQIPIEQRKESEVRTILGKIVIAPESVAVYNPAFDVTPARFIKAIITDKGIIKPPYNKNIKKVLCC